MSVDVVRFHYRVTVYVDRCSLYIYLGIHPIGRLIVSMYISVYKLRDLIRESGRTDDGLLGLLCLQQGSDLLGQVVRIDRLIDKFLHREVILRRTKTHWGCAMNRGEHQDWDFSEGIILRRGVLALKLERNLKTLRR